MFIVFFLMTRRPPRSTRTDTLFPYTTLFRSVHVEYIRITEQRYSRLGYEPYKWYRSDTPPAWCRLAKPLAQCRLGLVASGGVYVAGQVAYHYKDDTSLREIPKNVTVADLRFAPVPEHMLGDGRQIGRA